MKTKVFYLLVFVTCHFACNSNSKEANKEFPSIIFKLGDSINKLDSSGNEGLVIRFYKTERIVILDSISLLTEIGNGMKKRKKLH